MTVKRLFAVGFIFVMTAVAWFILGGNLLMRSVVKAQLAQKVEERWGRPLTQGVPGILDVQKKTLIEPASSDISVDLALDYRRMGLLWYANYTVTFTKAGYASQEHKIKRGVNGWYIGGNFFFGGLIGWLIVDPITGAMWTLERNCSAELAPLTSSSAGDAENLNIVSLADVPNDLRQHLRRVN
jgi:hypothetical protein